MLYQGCSAINQNSFIQLHMLQTNVTNIRGTMVHSMSYTKTWITNIMVEESLVNENNEFVIR